MMLYESIREGREEKGELSRRDLGGGKEWIRLQRWRSPIETAVPSDWDVMMMLLGGIDKVDRSSGF